MKRFWDKVKKANGCWEWLAAKDEFGYGYFAYDGGPKRAHRVSWILHNGEIPKNLLICHKCDNPACVRPDHLFIGTKKDNARDRSAKNRDADRKGEKNVNCFIKSKDVFKIRKMYSTGKYRQVDLAIIFGLTQAAISKIVLKSTWKHI